MVVGKEFLIRVGGGVVEFIYTDIIVVIRSRPLSQLGRIERLDTDKKMLDICRFSAIHI